MSLHDPFEHVPDGAKYLLDIASVGTLLATLASWLPSMAAGLTIIWTGIRIYETRTVRGWLGKSDTL